MGATVTGPVPVSGSRLPLVCFDSWSSSGSSELNNYTAERWPHGRVLSVFRPTTKLPRTWVTKPCGPKSPGSLAMRQSLNSDDRVSFEHWNRTWGSYAFPLKKESARKRCTGAWSALGLLRTSVRSMLTVGSGNWGMEYCRQVSADSKSGVLLSRSRDQMDCSLRRGHTGTTGAITGRSGTGWSSRCWMRILLRSI